MLKNGTTPAVADFAEEILDEVQSVVIPAIINESLHDQASMEAMKARSAMKSSEFPLKGTNLSSEVAIHEFAAGPSSDGEEDGNSLGPVVSVNEFLLKIDEMQGGGAPVMGPAGDVVQVFRIQDNDGNNVGNKLIALIQSSDNDDDECAPDPAADPAASENQSGGIVDTMNPTAA